MMQGKARQVMRWPFSRYISAGVVATAVHYIVLMALVEIAHVDPAIATASGAVCGALTAYVINARYTFSTKRPHEHSLPRFMLVATFAAGTNALLMRAGTATLHWNYCAVQILTTLLLVIITYQCNRRWSFS